MASTEIAKFTRDLNGQSKAIQSMLPAGLDPRRFMRTVVNTISTHPQSDRLLKANRTSLFSACQKAAGDGLLIDGRESTLIVFKDKKKNTETVNYIPMVQGLVKLARNSGEIANIISEVVFSNDSFQYRPGIDDQPVFDPDWFGQRGDAIGAYAVVITTNEEKIVRVLPKKRIMTIASTGRNADQFNPDTGVNFEEWWRKTAIKNVLKYAPKSSYLESAMASDTTSTFEVVSDAIDEEKDVTPEPLSDAEIGKMMDKIRDSISQSTSRKQLSGLQKKITELPVACQEELVIEWNERAAVIEAVEDKQQNQKSKTRPVAESGLDEHHVAMPDTGEIPGDIA
ncbi:recombinase RecT [Bacterioplanoides sp.]|uniref:recombinase RecT n=1 Tax=Bacterioplanoides sp. TaxID=2066072 RepID=UPI003B58EA9F